jgi:hypothetical protein
VDVKAEHFERQVQRVEQERDMWEKKYEVRPKHSRNRSRSHILSCISFAWSTGRTSEISRVQGRIGRARTEHGRPMIRSFYTSYSSPYIGIVPSLLSSNFMMILHELFLRYLILISYHPANHTIPSISLP